MTMKHILLGISIIAGLASVNIQAANKISDEASLKSAIAMANADSNITRIVFERNAQIKLTSPVIYTGKQALSLLGNDSTIDGAAVGSVALNADLTATSKGGALVFHTGANVTIQRLTVSNSALRGVVISIPGDAQGDDIQVFLHKVNILNSALYGLHVDDNADEFDEGSTGSAIGIKLNISQSNITGNGVGAIDFDGIRVDERGQGDIYVMINDTHIDGNGGDGLELDEGGEGDVDAAMKHVTFNNNGFYNAEDLDDGFDIDEAGGGDVKVSLFKVQVNNNKDEGLDFDEEDDGDMLIKLRDVVAINNTDENIKVEEQGAGDITARIFNVEVKNSTNDGIQITELGKGRIEAVVLKKVSATDNKKYGVLIEQWFEKGEEKPVEAEGSLEIEGLTLSGNGAGDELGLHNVVIK